MKKLCHSNAKREGKKTAGEMLDNFSKRNLCHAVFECATRTMNEGHRASSYMSPVDRAGPVSEIAPYL